MPVRVLVHNTAHMSPRLPLALSLTLSLALHLGLLAPELFAQRTQRPASPPPTLLARLRPPPTVAPAPAPPAAEELLKNTLDAKVQPPALKPTPPPPKAKAARTEARSASRNEVSGAQRKLSRHLFYPPEAIERGIEGEVRLLVRLADDGAIDEVSVAASSGHAHLDNAAIRAAYAMGALPGGPRELILPVVFQLQ